MKFQKSIIFFLAAAALVGCQDNKFSDVIPFPEQESESEEPGGEIVASSRDELYRPQIHYTPNANWINDPNGLVYDNGTWHLYYQYNPYGNEWGNMSWGHATSSDLVHWQEQPVAMTPNELGDIFSGSIVVDKNNTAGFGAGALVAIYTSAGEHQQQSIAYSNDGGLTFTQYSGNPVIANTEFGGFRDPKVFWHNESSKWIMTATRAIEDWNWDAFRIVFYASDNLKNWDFLSEFNIDCPRAKKGQWECPDLIKLPYNGSDKWVLIVSSNPGGVAGGSGTMYFVGNFDGQNFTADNLDYPLWLDYGADNYAGVTWSNTPDGRTIYIGWMNNWKYANSVPCDPWRSAMTLPRQLTLVDMNGTPVISSEMVTELADISGDVQEAENGICAGGDAYEMIVTLDPKEYASFTVGNEAGEAIPVEVDPASSQIRISRTSTSGNISFNGLFTIPSMVAPYDKNASELELHIFVDHSSVEILSNDGISVLTCLVFPSKPYDRITGADNVTYRALKTIW